MKILIILAADVLFCLLAWLTLRFIFVKKTPHLQHRRTIVSLLNAVIRCLFVWIIFAWRKDLFELLPEDALQPVGRTLAALTIGLGADALCRTISFLQSFAHEKFGRKAFSTKALAQVVNLVIWCAALVVIVSTLMGKSPAFILSGLGALTAVLMLIFKDAILGLVAGVQVAQNDMVRHGDWITMPQYNADGNVIDIALTTVKVQNFDNTVTMIPSSALISSSFINWRYMSISKGRRIKRPLWISAVTVCELSDEMHARLAAAKLIKPNQKYVSNLAAFEDWVRDYLRNHEDITQELTCMVRQTEAGAEGVPVEIYCFTKTRDWEEYERIQTAIFDHLFVMAPKFGLEIYERTSARREPRATILA